MSRPVEIVEATHGYERWLARHMPLLRRDIELKHQWMANDALYWPSATVGCAIWP